MSCTGDLNSSAPKIPVGTVAGRDRRAHQWHCMYLCVCCLGVSVCMKYVFESEPLRCTRHSCENRRTCGADWLGAQHRVRVGSAAGAPDSVRVGTGGHGRRSSTLRTTLVYVWWSGIVIQRRSGRAKTAVVLVPWLGFVFALLATPPFHHGTCDLHVGWSNGCR